MLGGRCRPSRAIISQAPGPNPGAKINRSMQLHLSWQRTAVALVLLAAALPLAARALAGPPGAVVHVRWQSSLDDSAREDLEARFRLADGERIEGTTWRYDLVDP